MGGEGGCRVVGVGTPLSLVGTEGFDHVKRVMMLGKGLVKQGTLTQLHKCSL